MLDGLTTVTTDMLVAISAVGVLTGGVSSDVVVELVEGGVRLESLWCQATMQECEQRQQKALWLDDATKLTRLSLI